MLLVSSSEICVDCSALSVYDGDRNWRDEGLDNEDEEKNIYGGLRIVTNELSLASSCVHGGEIDDDGESGLPILSLIHI